MDKFMKRAKENRFLLLLTAILSIGAVSAFILGKEPTDNIGASFRNFSANLTAEIVGAIVSVWIINSLLERHQKHSLRDIISFMAETVRLSVYETSSKALGIISDPKYEMVNSSEYNELLDTIIESQATEAFKHLEALTGELYYPPLDAIAYTEAKNMAHAQLKEWIDFQMRFQPYLLPNQFTVCAKIIDRLRDIYSGNNQLDRLFQRMDDSQKSMHAGKMAPQLADEIIGLTRECLELLETTSC